MNIIGNATLHYGDCLSYMKRCPDKSIDFIITDPPYGINRDKGFDGAEGFNGKGKAIERVQYTGEWDSERPSKEYFDEMLRVSKVFFTFGGNYFSDYLPVAKHWIVWDKRNTMPTFGDCELVYTTVNRNSVKIITKEYNGLIGKEEHRFHATQKPLKILYWILNNYTKEGDTILDPFMGSGSLGVACNKLNRHFIGCERDKDYFSIAIKRIEETNQQLSLL